MESYQQQLQNIEMQLSDTALYQAENKAKLTALLNEQIQLKKALEEVEMSWFTLQEELENLINNME